MCVGGRSRYEPYQSYPELSVRGLLPGPRCDPEAGRKCSSLMEISHLSVGDRGGNGQGGKGTGHGGFYIERTKVTCMCERGPCGWAVVGNKPERGDSEESRRSWLLSPGTWPSS